MTQLKKILINATNLNEGGGVQVATSFLKDLVSMGLDKNLEFSVYVSAAVDRNLEEKFFDKNIFFNYQIVESKKISFVNSHKLNYYDIVFTVFGPMFLPFYKKKHISGFAQPWVIYPVGDVLRKFNFPKRLIYLFKYFLASCVFRQADVLVVESNYIKHLLIQKGYSNTIEVVENAVSSIFFKEDQWQEICSDVFNQRKINIGVLSGSYPHKNLDFIIDLAAELEVQHPETFNFIFTLDSEKFNELPKQNKLMSVVNLGVITLQECPSFYHQIDGVILPSLLECFSITPYEAMLMKKVMFLSDRDFFTRPCLDHAIYFDPLSVDSAVKALSKWYFDKSDSYNIHHIDAAHRFIVNGNRSIDKAKSYIKLLLDLN
jgi:glycosyltransferase involved in cell wall biosynthesis